MAASSATDKLTGEEHSSAFGRLLRFWRRVLGISQATLAASLETSPRHLSFLETGRSNPSRSMVNRLAGEFALNERDHNALLVAAGFTPALAELDLAAPAQRHLRRMLKLVLEKQEPYPAVILDRCGNIKLCNQALLDLFGCYLDKERLQPPLNLYQLYFSEQGLRPFIQGWETTARHTLFLLQQELLLTGDPALAQLFGDLCSYPGVPRDWALRVKDEQVDSSYAVRLKVTEAWQSNCVAVVTALDPMQGGRPNLLMHSFYPADEITRGHWETAVAAKPQAHPLLP